ncbi:MAG TPA: hypothetical protein VMI54_03865 [Polyangiaceae bacterium]|nr:hypothetical protein [Polyangiaceae bacterium]
MRALRWLALPLSLGLVHVACEQRAFGATPTKSKTKKKTKKKAGPSMDDNAGRDVDEGGTAPGTTDSKSSQVETEQVPATKPKPVETAPEAPKPEEDEEAPPEPQGPPEPPSPFSQNWIGITIQQSFLVYGDQKGVCPSIDDNNKEYPGAAGYSCRDASGYHRGDVYAGGGNEVHGGFGIGDLRFLIGYDRVLGTNLVLGGRFGVAILQSPAVTGTTAPLPLHGEAHLYYYFGESPFMIEGLRPFVGLAGGVAEVDGKVSVVYYKDHVGYQNNLQGRLDVWRKVGPGFAAARAGFGYPFGHFMLNVEANLPFYFAYTGFAPSLGVGLAYGF